jgi:hypothetical protein
MLNCRAFGDSDLMITTVLQVTHRAISTFLIKQAVPKFPQAETGN